MVLTFEGVQHVHAIVEDGDESAAIVRKFEVGTEGLARLLTGQDKVAKGTVRVLLGVVQLDDALFPRRREDKAL